MASNFLITQLEIELQIWVLEKKSFLQKKKMYFGVKWINIVTNIIIKRKENSWKLMASNFLSHNWKLICKFEY